MKSKLMYVLAGILFMLSVSFVSAADTSCAVTTMFGEKAYDGQVSGDVTRLQNFLISNGYLAEGNNTGNFGPLTLAAVKAFQSANNIESTGFVGPITRAKISQIGCGSGEVLGLFSRILSPRKEAVFKTVDKGTLKLTYDSAKKESLLTGNQQVSVAAGSEDVFIDHLGMSFKGKISVPTPNGIHPNSTSANFSPVLSNAVTRETIMISIPGTDQTYEAEVWKVKAGKTAIFDLSISAAPKDMYAGVYSAYISYGAIYKGKTSDDHTQVNISAINTDSVTIVGESGVITPPNPGKVPNLSMKVLILDKIDASKNVTSQVNEAVDFTTRFFGIKINTSFLKSSLSHGYTQYCGNGTSSACKVVVNKQDLHIDDQSKLKDAELYSLFWNTSPHEPLQAGSTWGPSMGIIDGKKSSPYATMPVDIWWWLDNSQVGFKTRGAQIMTHELVNMLYTLAEAKPETCKTSIASTNSNLASYEYESTRLKNLYNACGYNFLNPPYVPVK